MGWFSPSVSEFGVANEVGAAPIPQSILTPERLLFCPLEGFFHETWREDKRRALNRHRAKIRE